MLVNFREQSASGLFCFAVVIFKMTFDASTCWISGENNDR